MKRTLRFTIRISSREREALELLALQNGLSESAALRLILRQAISDAAPMGVFPPELIDDLHITPKYA